MNIFCMSCGAASTYLGVENKPRFCASCGKPFGGVAAVAEEHTGQNTNQPIGIVARGGVYEIDGEILDSNFLLNLITIEDDGIEEKRPRVSRTSKKTKS